MRLELHLHTRNVYSTVSIAPQNGANNEPATRTKPHSAASYNFDSNCGHTPHKRVSREHFSHVHGGLSTQLPLLGLTLTNFITHKDFSRRRVQLDLVVELGGQGPLQYNFVLFQLSRFH